MTPRPPEAGAAVPSAADVIDSILGEAATLTPFPGNRNDSCRVSTASGDDYVLKLYADAESVSFETKAYELFAGEPFARRVRAAGTVEDGRPFLLLDFVGGTLLADAVDDLCADERLLASVLDQLEHLLLAAAAVRVDGFGHATRELSAPFSAWPACLSAHLEELHARLERLERPSARAELAEALAELDHAFARYAEALASVRPTLLPIDLNLRNLLLTPDGRLVLLDLESFWGADSLLALGEWACHTYATPLYSGLLRRRHVVRSADPGLLRFYALLATATVMMFVEELGIPATEAMPWGGRFTFGELVRAHTMALRAPEHAAERLLAANPRFGHVWERRSLAQGDDFWLSRRALLSGDRVIAGVTRVADITALDTTGVNVVQTVRPLAQADTYTFTVFAGAGSTPAECEVRATAEAVERFCAERSAANEESIVTASYRALAAEHAVVHPERFNLPPDAAFDETEDLEWFPAYDLATGERHFVPACMVFYPYFPKTGRALCQYFTTGLAAGASYVAAASHGLAEVIERDAAALNRILRNRPAVDLGTIDDVEIREDLERFRNAGLHVIVRDITPPEIGVPAFSVILDDPALPDPVFASGGYAAHPDRRVALLRALREAAQSRAGTISGAREDLKKFDTWPANAYAEFRRKYAYWFDDLSNVRRFGDVPTHPHLTALEDLAWMWSAVRLAGFDLVLVAELFRPDLRLRVVKVLVPGIERYSYKIRCVGPRAREQYQAKYGKPLRPT